jgi:pyridoxal phosphate enzyme (YggS family)
MVGSLVEKNLEQVRNRIKGACARVQREALSVRLVAVSKAQPMAKIQQAWSAKQNVFGENYVQEALTKVASLPEAEWHFIGTLQSNKVKQVVGAFTLIHSVDRESVLREISKRAVEKGLVQEILLEINLAGEATKSGVDWAAAELLLQTGRGLPGLCVRGLMGMPPPGTAEASRPYFRELCEKWKSWRDLDFSELSMGTSQDFEVAIEEGATLVRIGTDVFGPRE